LERSLQISGRPQAHIANVKAYGTLPRNDPHEKSGEGKLRTPGKSNPSEILLSQGDRLNPGY
jgi:hypothetical protein